MKLDFAQMKPGIVNCVILFLMILVVVPVGKYALTQFYIPGLSELAKAV